MICRLVGPQSASIMSGGDLIAEGDSVVFEVNGERMSIITAHKST